MKTERTSLKEKTIRNNRLTTLFSCVLVIPGAIWLKMGGTELGIAGVRIPYALEIMIGAAALVMIYTILALMGLVGKNDDEEVISNRSNR